MVVMKRMMMWCGLLAGCGGASAGGGGYDSAMQRLLTAQPADIDVVGEWTDPSTSQMAVVTKSPDGTLAVALVSGSATLPPLSSLEGGKIEPEKHKVAHGVLVAWANGKPTIGGGVVLMANGMWRESHDNEPCTKVHGISLDQKKDKAGEPVLWVSMYSTTGEAGLPRTIYFQRTKDHKIDAASLAKIQDFAKQCVEAPAAKADAPPAATP
jgi:hypothetical protein